MTLPVKFPLTEGDAELQRRLVKRSPLDLRLHPALAMMEWRCPADELNCLSRLQEHSTLESIAISTSGIILAGFGQWHFATLKQWGLVECFEYEIGENQALLFIVSQNHPHRLFNDFVRIRLALGLQPYLRQQALEHMVAGGKYKGSATLPKAEHVDVRKEVADIAAVGSRNVSKVLTILDKANPQLIAALVRGKLSIHRAMQLCQWPKSEQVDEFVRQNEDRGIRRLIRQAGLPRKKLEPTGDALKLLESLRLKELQNAGSVRVLLSQAQQTTLVVGKDMRSQLKLEVL